VEAAARSRQSWTILAVGIALSLALLLLAGRNLHWEQVRAALAGAQLGPWLPLAVLSYLVGHFVRGLRTRRLVSRDAELTTATATSVVVVGYAVNNILPARLGEFARAGMLTERTGLPIAQSLTVTLLERILDGWVLSLFLGLTILAIPVAGTIHEVAEIAAAVFLLATAAIGLVLLAPSFFIGAVSRSTSRLPERWHDRMIRIGLDVAQGLAYLRRPRDAARVFGLSVVVWTLEAGLFLFLLPAFALPFDPWWALLALSVTNLGILLPSTPGYVVVFHYFCQQALASVGVAPAVGVSYAVVVHLGFYVPITLWGIGIILWYGLQLGQTIAMARQARRVTFPIQ
jgi:uncharacterized protein (TIRG00374 family)